VTEALISIDINSSRATKGGDIEETALNTNLEASDEIARQLRIRDIGGLVVIDYIDMSSTRNQKEVETRLQNALESDRARVQVGRISRFGLLEMSRQRLRPSLAETSGKVCPQCSGQGTIRDTKSVALSILRLLEEEAQKERSGEIRAIAPVNVATFLLNEKRAAIYEIEQRNGVRVVIVPNTDMVLPHFDVKRLRDDDEALAEVSYDITLETDEEINAKADAVKAAPVKPNVPAVQNIAPATPAPESAPKALVQEAGAISQFFSKLLKSLFGDGEKKEETPAKSPAQQRNDRNGGRDRNNNRNGGRDRNNRGGRDRNRSGGRDRNAPRGEAGDRPQQDRQRNDQQRNDRPPRDQNRPPRDQNRPPRDQQRHEPRHEPRHEQQGQARSEQPKQEQQAGADQAGYERQPRRERGRDRARDGGRRPQGGGERRPHQDATAAIETFETPAFVPVADIATKEYEGQQDTQQHKPAAREPRPAPAAREQAAAQTAAVVASVAEVAPVQQAPRAPRDPNARSSNDPRLQPKRDRVMEIITETANIPVPVIPTELAPTTRAERPRSPNDPRAKKQESNNA
jgi:ribonuclease E